MDDPVASTHILINTCGFVEDAKRESIGAILDACVNYPGSDVLVMGCLVERYRDELRKEIPEVAGWFGLADSPRLIELLGDVDGNIPNLSQQLTAVPYAYLKISDGCDEPCTFCAIPGIKGPYYSVEPSRILTEAEACLTEGARELVLVGQDTAVWRAQGLDLMGLIDRLVVDERVWRVRLMYLQPEHVTEELLSYMAGQPKLCRYLDIPFQHADPEVLRRMGRWGSGDVYAELVANARRLMPDVSVRSTFIVGFPGETERQFEALMNFVDAVGFDHAGGFIYSPEEDTPAFALRPRVRRSVALDRLNRLTATLVERAEVEHQRLVGASIEVIVDSVGPEESGAEVVAVGRTEGQAPEVDGVTYIEGRLPGRVMAGDVVTVTMTDAMGYDLVGVCDAS